MDGMGCIIIPWIHSWDIPHLRYNDSLFPPFRHPVGGCPATVPGYDVSVTGRTASGVSETFQCDGFPWPHFVLGGQAETVEYKAGRTPTLKHYSPYVRKRKWFLAQLLPKMKLRTSDRDSIDS